MLPNADHSEDPRVQRAIRLIQQPSRAAAVDVRQLASDVNLSHSLFRHVFTEQIGVSPKQYLKTVRLNRAKWLMTNTFLSVKQVMAAVGCSDISHFVRDYKIVFGETPTQSRRSKAAAKRSRAATSANC